MKILDRIDSQSDGAFTFFWQMIGPLFILCTFALAPSHLLIFSLGVLGLFLSARFQIKGFFAALAVLSVAAIGEHMFSNSPHLWLFGLEISYALAFLITALNADYYNYFVKNLLLQIEAKSSFILNAEEEFAKSRAEVSSQQVLLQEKVDLLQRQIEEVLAEQSSLLILNEVLRKTTSRHIEDQALLQGEVLYLQNCAEFSLQAQRQAEEEISRLKNESALIQDRENLIDEINRVRLDREQTHMINETLACLHAKESMRAESLEEQKRQMETKFRAELQELEQRKEPALCHFEEEKSAIDLSQYVPKEEMVHLERLHKQLKGQFEEKNEVLHRTRKELFHLDNALQTLQIEKEFSQEVPREVLSEMMSLQKEISDLAEENEELENLVTILSSLEESVKRKKKVKVIPNQGYLF